MKKLLVLVLSLCMILSQTAYGSSDWGVSAAMSTKTAWDPAATPTPRPTPTPVPVRMTAFRGDITHCSQVPFRSATASSIFMERSGLTYYPTNVIDDTVSWPWVEGAPGNGTGEYIVLSFDGIESIDVLGLHLGFSTAYRINPRPRKVQFDFSDGTYLQYEFEDLNQMQYVQFSKTVETSYIRITILSVYPTTRDNDASITAVKAFRQY